MGRKKLEIKKIKLSISVDDDNMKKLNEHNLNKSKFINWIILNYFNDKAQV